MPRFITEWKAWSTGDVVAGSGGRCVNWVRQGGPMVNEHCHPKQKSPGFEIWNWFSIFFVPADLLMSIWWVQPVNFANIFGWVRWEVSQWQSPAYRSILPMRSWLNSQGFEVPGDSPGNPRRVFRWGWWWWFLMHPCFFLDPWKLAYHHKICIISDNSNMELWSKFIDWNVSTYWSNMIWPKLCRSSLYLEASLRFLDP